MILWLLKQEEKRILNTIQSITRTCGSFPTTDLLCCKNGKYFKYYQTDGHTRTYIPKDEQNLARTLAAKEYYLRLNTFLYHIKKMIAYYERHIEQNQAAIDTLFAPNSGYKPLLEKSSNPIDFSDWAAVPYETNPVYPEGKKFRTQTGIYVRSKSEKMIADTLTAYQISYRYEAALHLEYTVYPDFTIRHPETGELYYYEHFGMVDNPDYRKKMFNKLDLYIRYGMLDLLYTIETKDRPLTVEQIEQALAPIFRKPFAQAS
ncbi:MAG: hypothetical protein IKU26_01575 [Clostridia bacterium]|nr:hypothetical protein [Clostridia bacterium]